MTEPLGVLIPDVDRALFGAAFADRLRRGGVEVGLPAAQAFVRALAVASPQTRSQLYHLARVTLVHRQPDLARFDRVFDGVFDVLANAVPAPVPDGRRPGRAGTSWAGPPASRARNHREADGEGLPASSLPGPGRAGEAPAADRATALPERLPSGLAALADTPFDEFDPADLVLLDDWFAAAARDWPTRRTRRQVLHPAGQAIALRPTLTRARRTGWEPVHLVRTARIRRRRRLVVLCDVSQSMQPYAGAYLHLLRSAVTSSGAEVFAFATTLTRLTPVLAHRSPAEVLEQASAAVSDRFGGTRIATSLKTLLASRHGAGVRGGIVIIASDGWDADEPCELARAMARLQRRAYRLVWLNPRSASSGYAPLVRGMAAALPFCDAFLPAHTPAALTEVLHAVLDERPGGRGRTRA